MNNSLHEKLVREKIPKLLALQQFGHSSKTLRLEAPKNKMMRLSQIMSKMLFRTMAGAFSTVKSASVQFIRNQTDLSYRFDASEQEKEILEDEL